VENRIDLATAVAASAAYPVFLPALDSRWEFERDRSRAEPIPSWRRTRSGDPVTVGLNELASAGCSSCLSRLGQAGATDRPGSIRPSGRTCSSAKRCAETRPGSAVAQRADQLESGVGQ
jgi:hypothetical protein